MPYYALFRMYYLNQIFVTCGLKVDGQDKKKNLKGCGLCEVFSVKTRKGPIGKVIRDIMYYFCFESKTYVYILTVIYILYEEYPKA